MTTSRTASAAEEQKAATALSRPSRAAFVPAAGLAFGRFFGLPYRSGLVDLGVRLEARRLRWTAGLELEGGATEHGLSILRTAVGGGVESAGRLRAGIGPRLSYSMVVRATTGDFERALFGDIGGVGIGAHAWLAVDVLRRDAFVLGLSVRGAADAYDGSTAARAAALFEAAF